ncbi:MAG: hypothetical protein MJK15_17795, partial [Colwellia sp.]|nr:hypothetical protein [Colwellia sp.]
MTEKTNLNSDSSSDSSSDAKNSEQITEVNTEVNKEAVIIADHVDSSAVTEATSNAADAESTVSAFTLVRHDNGIAHLVIDVIGESVNTMKTEFAEQFDAVLAEIKDDKTITGIVLC